MITRARARKEILTLWSWHAPDMVACQVWEPMLTPYTVHVIDLYVELFAPKTINILALLKRHNVIPAIYIYITVHVYIILYTCRYYTDQFAQGDHENP